VAQASWQTQLERLIGRIDRYRDLTYEILLFEVNARNDRSRYPIEVWDRLCTLPGKGVCPGDARV
jgi:hypothetical protein